MGGGVEGRKVRRKTHQVMGEFEEKNEFRGMTTRR